MSRRNFHESTLVGEHSKALNHLLASITIIIYWEALLPNVQSLARWSSDPRPALVIKLPILRQAKRSPGDFGLANGTIFLFCWTSGLTCEPVSHRV